MESISSSEETVDIRVILGSSSHSPVVEGVGRLASRDSKKSSTSIPRRRDRSKSSPTSMPASTATSVDSDIFTYYSALSNQFFSSDASNHAQAEDPLHFLDESLFFVDKPRSQPFFPPGLPSSPPKKGSSTKENKRVSFSKTLNDCRQYRMSTIVESPAIEDTPASPAPTASTHARAEDEPVFVPSRSASKKSKRVSWATQASTFMERPSTDFNEPTQQQLIVNPIQRVGLKKLLDYIVPYPTKPLTKPSLKKRRKRSASAPSPVLAPVPVFQPSDSSSSEGSPSFDETEWVMHGFFEIRSQFQLVQS